MQGFNLWIFGPLCFLRDDGDGGDSGGESGDSGDSGGESGDSGDSGGESGDSGDDGTGDSYDGGAEGDEGATDGEGVTGGESSPSGISGDEYSEDQFQADQEANNWAGYANAPNDAGYQAGATLNTDESLSADAATFAADASANLSAWDQNALNELDAAETQESDLGYGQTTTVGKSGLSTFFGWVTTVTGATAKGAAFVPGGQPVSFIAGGLNTLSQFGNAALNFMGLDTSVTYGSTAPAGATTGGQNVSANVSAPAGASNPSGGNLGGATIGNDDGGWMETYPIETGPARRPDETGGRKVQEKTPVKAATKNTFAESLFLAFIGAILVDVLLNGDKNV